MPGLLLSNFYPRPPRGGRRNMLDYLACIQIISIHALREEGDKLQEYVVPGRSDFYPRPPRGGRRVTSDHFYSLVIISIHALREEGDQRHYPQLPPHHHFYPRPPRGGRRNFTLRPLKGC